MTTTKLSNLNDWNFHLQYAVVTLCRNQMRRVCIVNHEAGVAREYECKIDLCIKET